LIVVNSSYLRRFYGAFGSTAETASPPTDEAGPSPIELNAITLTNTCVPYAKLNGGACKVLIGMMQLAEAITD
jgi:hypothetical protein